MKHDETALECGHMWIHGRSPYLPSPNPSPWSWLPVSNTPLQSILEVVIPGGHAKGFQPDFSTALPTITWYYCTIYYNLLCILLLSLTLHLLYLLTLVLAPSKTERKKRHSWATAATPKTWNDHGFQDCLRCDEEHPSSGPAIAQCTCEKFYPVEKPWKTYDDISWYIMIWSIIRTY